nr:hypothetical protein [Tanacetum cinerariifolium]
MIRVIRIYKPIRLTDVDFFPQIAALLKLGKHHNSKRGLAYVVVIGWKQEGNDDDQDSDEEGEEFIYPRLSIHDEEETKDEESFDPIAKTLENSDDKGNDEENLSLNIGREEGQDEEDDEDELYRDVNINLEGRVVQMDDVHTTQEFEDSHVTLTPVNPDGQQQSSSVSSQFVTSMLNPTPDAGIDFIFEITSQMDVQARTTVAPLPLSTPTLTHSTIVPQAPTLSTTAPSTLFQDLHNFGSLFGFDHRLKTLEANFSEFVQTNQFVGPVSSIPVIVQRYMDQQMNEAVKTVNEQLEAKVLTRSSNSSKTSYVFAADLSEMELKKILIEKIEGNKSIHRSDEQRNLYKALVEAYESDKIILDTYRDTVTLKRHRDNDADKDEEPSTGSDRGSKRRREGNEPDESATAEEPMQTTHEMKEPSHPEFKTGAADDQPIAEASQHHEWFSQQKKPLNPDRDWNKTLPATHGSIQPWISELAKQTDYRSSFNVFMDTPHTLWGISHWGRKHQQFYGFAVNRKSARDVYSKHRIIAVTELKIVEWHNYKHLDWIMVCRDADKLYKFKEGDFKRLRIQDIEDMLLLLVQGKLINLMVEERFAFNVSLRMFTRSIVIQTRMEYLQLGVKSYQKKLNLTRPDTYRFDLKRNEAYTAYSNPRGFIYQNKDKQNRLIRIDESHKFSDGTLNNVRTALDDRLKGIKMKYMPQTIWRKSDKERAATMIQAIDKQLKTKRIMRSLERFVGGRLYDGDFRMLQWTI